MECQYLKCLLIWDASGWAGRVWGTNVWIKRQTRVPICSWSNFWEVVGQQLCEEEDLDAVGINSLLRMPV